MFFVQVEQALIRRFSGVVVLVAAIFLAMAPYGYSQANTASISGSVVDPQNRPVAGATVVVSNTDLSSKRAVVTDVGGGFRVSNLVPGAFTVEASAKSLTSRRPVRLTL